MTWTQRESLRRLAYALRPLIDRGMDSVQIAGELYGLFMGWRPAKPAAFIQAALARDAQHDGDLAARRPAQPTSTTDTVEPSAEWNCALGEMGRREEESLEVVAEVGEGQLVDVARLDPADISALRSAAEADLDMVLGAIAVGGEPYARRLYSPDLVRQATASCSSTMVLNSTWQQA
ncbi:hypothetical protein [Streptomyces sp. NPDC048636]|uniref:hypothetical protein n=1 Tax=Streptomyces sp. NPDC048636 TaxID=3155762 RepID=UPI00341B4366